MITRRKFFAALAAPLAFVVRSRAESPLLEQEMLDHERSTRDTPGSYVFESTLVSGGKRYSLGYKVTPGATVDTARRLRAAHSRCMERTLEKLGVKL